MDTQSSCMPLGEPETFMSTFQMTWGLDGLSAEPLSCKPKFSLGQKCLSIKSTVEAKQFHQEWKKKKRKKEIISTVSYYT